MLAALAMLAAACSDTSALGPADSAGDAPLGPTVLSPSESESEQLGGSGGDTTRSVTIAPPPPLPPTVPLPPPPTTLPPPEPVTVLAVGNLGRCNASSTQVAEAVAADAGLILAVGDLSADGSQASIDECFLAALEPELGRIYAVPGNRDLATGDPAAFTDLVERTPTDAVAGRGWFVTTLGGWQIIGLNSRCDDVGGCDADSEQYQWLDAVLRDQPAECRAAIWHDARFTSAAGEDDATAMGALLGRLDGAGTDVLITGSPTNYERLGPLRPGGALAAGDELGMQHFNIGGGSGAGFDQLLQPGSQVREDTSNGYVRFVFGPDGYAWEFVATSESSSAPDIGSGTC